MTRSLDWRTPALSVNDGRGLPTRQVVYLRTVAQDTATPLVNRQQHNASGQLAAQWDPRLPVPCLTTVYRLDGEPLKTDSVDAGWRLILPGLAGEPVQRWDERDSHWRTTFDKQLRVVAVEENGVADVDVFTYADASADPRFNRRGQLLEQHDNSGTLRTDSFALTGQPLAEIRTFDDGQGFTSRRVFSPMGAVLEQTDAGGHRQKSCYGLAGHLRQVQLLIKDQSQWRPVLLDAQYNAADQIIEQQAGNLVLSRWTYDPADGRLHTQSSRKDTGAVLQDLEYFYDPVGNITRIEDHAFQPVYFANQLVDGHRDFSYDSLYRLVCARGYDDGPLSDIPDLPKPTDPNNRLNYTQTYTYDTGGNLEKLVHVRAGANRTVQMRIDSVSNRGVRWKPDDPEPDFDTLFDRHGNLQNLQPGQAMQWNARGELQRVTLIARDGTDDDAEHYRYSQGVRVFKRHETYTDRAVHFHQVRYLPGLEIRTKDNCEELHVISVGGARCLHWAKKPPEDIEDNQLRYSLGDHLGSCTIELDQRARIISQEGYYPFGATAWMAADPVVEVGYRFIRYSGKEMDISGLYCYGARYYAPWLQRWISADPAGEVDGLNLYAFVGNDPIGHVDVNGETRLPFLDEINAGTDRIIASQNTSYAKNAQRLAEKRMARQMNDQMMQHIEILGITQRRASDAAKQLDRMGSGSDIALATTRRTLVFVASKALSYGVGLTVGVGAQALGVAAPGVGNVIGAGMGFAAKIGVSALIDYAAERTGLSASVNLKTSKVSANTIIERAQHKQMQPLEYLNAKLQGLIPRDKKSALKLVKEAGAQLTSAGVKETLNSLPPAAAGAIASGAAALWTLPEIVNETAKAISGKSSEKMLAFEGKILGLAQAIEASNDTVHEYAHALGRTSLNGVDLNDLDEETARITDMLHGLALTVQKHRTAHSAAA
ncbi:RHS repeat-associated core domain-containing protein [Pseudomonas tensinigenes]|uniref:RHS repeat-associated core domain-containing protein n=1 Tax=Pseudomonas tensinigenes TaxID=2745511 RepID=A0ABX8PVG7_9PSED|nr:RHS repeat-associated core domain-containing protein [Pseudomonas tensinigenes]QXI05081.1 RHS repeat-associated core domain-containing protein [Pseudomonas tensinigenes]